MSDHRPSEQDNEPEGRCAKCGACTVVCPVYRASGNEIYSARGKRHLAEVFKDGQPGPVFEDIYSKCLLCGACSKTCPQHLDITGDVIAAREQFSAMYGEHGYQKFLARKALNRPELLGAARVLGSRAANILFGRLPAGSGLRLRLAMFTEAAELPETTVVDRPLREVAGSATSLAYFPGCAARYLYPDIEQGVNELFSSFGYELATPEGLACCGLATMASGHPEEARRLARTNIRLLEHDDGPILASCGSCFAQLAGYGKLLENDPEWKSRAELVSERVVEISYLVEELLQEQRFPGSSNGQSLRVFYHDPCHMRHDHQITEEPRLVLGRIQEIELLELPDGPQCCGQGGLFHVGAPKLSARIRDDLAAKIIELAPDLITTSCSGCLMQLKSAMAAAGSTIPVLHLASLINRYHGQQQAAAAVNG
jgi:glycolate oxidase iron-sulfur subunit